LSAAALHGCLAAPAGAIAGVVSEFDEATGLGSVELAGFGAAPFHCTAVTDGSRHIDPGVAVLTCLAARHLGRFEAVAVTPAAPAAPA
jgi:hypothetical protein